MKRLGDSLLTRSTKCSDLIGQLEDEVGDSKETPDGLRASKYVPQYVFLTWSIWKVQEICEIKSFLPSIEMVLRSVKDLENAIKILEGEYETIEALKVEVSNLKSVKEKDPVTDSITSPETKVVICF